MKRSFPLLAALLLAPFAAFGAPFDTALWIGFGDPVVDHVDSRFAFRKSLELSAKQTSRQVRVTADARYMLWVNGQFVGRGPARGFPWAQPYDELDLDPLLRPGEI